MVRVAALIPMLLALVLASAASAHDLGPENHGPDSAAVDRGPEPPAPSGGATGRPLTSGQRVHAGAGTVAGSLPSLWCGTSQGSDHTQNELGNGSYRYHAIYALPADGVSRLSTVGSTMQSDAFQASGLVEQLYGRAIRYDMGTSCGSQYLDISVVYLPQTTAQLQGLTGTPTGTFDAVADALDAAGFDVLADGDSSGVASALTKNYVVWLDGPGPAGYCGQGMLYGDTTRSVGNWNNYGGKVAMVFRSGQSFCGSTTVRHEIGHTLGALQEAAPHAFDGAHCNDAREDTMCYSSAPARGGGPYFDYGRDDYWDPAGGSLPWWTVNLNRFLCPDTTCNVTAVASSPTAAPATSTAAPAAAAVIDGDGDGVADTADNCPQVANAAQANGYGDSRGDACEARPAAAPERGVRTKVTSHRGGKWKLSIAAKGAGRAVLRVTCKARGRSTAVLKRRIALPKQIAASAKCAAKPSVTLAAH